MAPSTNKVPLVGYGLPLKEPKLYDVLAAWKAKLLINLHVAKPGRIVAYTYPTATVEILGQRVMKDGTTSAYPQLQNVPVLTMQGGGFSLQFPIKAGDQCLVIFADRNIDAWYQNGNSQPPLDGRLHDISDGFAIVGINWQSDPTLPTPSSTEARLIDSTGLTKVGMQAGKVTIANATGTLLTVINGLITVIEALTVLDDEGGNILPLTPAAIAALEAYKLIVAGLLY